VDNLKSPIVCAKNAINKYMDPRHQKRINIIQNLFAYDFSQKTDTLPFPDCKTTLAVISKLEPIDKYINQYTDKYGRDKMAKTDLAILRLSVYELLYDKQNPDKVVVNEAIELAKDMAGEQAYAFINAILGKIIELKSKNEKPDQSGK